MSKTAEILYEVWRKAVYERATGSRHLPPFWHELPEEHKQGWDAVAEAKKGLPPRVGSYCPMCGVHESEMHLERCPYAPRPAYLQGEQSTIHICTCGGSSVTGHTKTCATRTPINYEEL